MGVVGACRSCAEYRYCGAVDPKCRYCAGTGRIVGGDREGVNPIVVLRAALMGLEADIARDRLVAAGLLDGVASVSTTVEPSDYQDRARLGREAGALLVELGLRQPKPRKVLTPAERAERRREKAAERERSRLMGERIKRQARERAERVRRQEVETRAARAIAEAHPAEYEHEREAQEVFVALEEGFGPYLPPAVRRVLES